jgi:hypothetical protein
MDVLHRLDDQPLTDVDDFAQDTPWLHGAVPGYANCGVVFFAALPAPREPAMREASAA